MSKKLLLQALVLVLFAAFAIASSNDEYKKAAAGVAGGVIGGYTTYHSYDEE